MIDLTTSKPLNKGQLFAKMRESLYPVWVLFEIQGFEKCTRRKYDCAIDGTEEQRIEKSIEALQRELANYNPNTFFAIDLKKTVKSGSDGVYDNIVFTNMDTMQTQMNGLGSISNNQAPQNNDYISKDYFDKMMEYMKKEQSLVAREAVLENEQKRIKELENKFNSGVEKFGKVVTDYGPTLLKGVAGMFVPGSGSNAPALSGTVEVQENNTQQQNNNGSFKVEPDTEDPREQKAVDIANKLFESGVSIEKMEEFLNKINNTNKPE